MRDYINEGGKVLYAGKHAGQQYAEGYEFRNFGFPQPNEDQQGRWCDAELPRGARTAASPHTTTSCSTTSARTSGRTTATRGTPDGTVFPVTGEDPFGPATTWTFANHGRRSGAPARRPRRSAVTSSMIDRPAYQDSRRLAGWDRPGAGPFSPYTGAVLHGLGHDDEAYKRLHTEVDLTGADARQADVQDVVRPRAGLGLRVRRGAPGRHRAVDDAAGRQRPHHAGDGRQLLDRRRLGRRAARAAAATTRRVERRHLHADRHDRRVERRDRQLERLAGVGDRPQPVRGPAGRGRDRRRDATGPSGDLGAWVDDATRRGRRRDGVATSFETDTGVWSVGPVAGGHAERRAAVDAQHRSSSRRARSSARPTRSTPASRSRR